MQKILALILSLIVVFQPSLNVFGQAWSFLDFSATNTVHQDTEAIEQDLETNELVHKREANVKHFAEDESSYRAEIYPFPVHYQHGEDWFDIDNTLIEAKDRSGNPVIHNKSNSFQVQFAGDQYSEQLWSLIKGNYAISWNLAAEKQSIKPVIYNLDETDSKLVSVLEYEDIVDGLTVTHMVEPKGLKTWTTVASQESVNQLAFDLYVVNLNAQSSPDGSIVFFDPEDKMPAPVFTLQSPEIIDAAGERIDVVEYELKQSNNGYSLLLLPDADWLADPERAFPIFIEATKTALTGPENVEMVSVSVEDSDEQAVGLSTAETYSFSRIQLPELDAEATITSANFNHRIFERFVDYPTQMSLHQVLEGWDINQIPEGVLPEYESEEINPQSLPDLAHFTWDITEMVKSWHNGADNHGVVLKGVDYSAAKDFSLPKVVAENQVTKIPLLVLEFQDADESHDVTTQGDDEAVETESVDVDSFLSTGMDDNSILQHSIFSGFYHNLAIKHDGTAWSWGRNNYGQLGDGTVTYRDYPVQVEGLTDVKAVAGGQEHSVALKADGTVWAWGRNNNGQLGDGTLTTRRTPIQVEGLTDVIALSCGSYHSVALKSDGTVWSWGLNNAGQLGDGTLTNRRTPVQVIDLDGIVNIFAGMRRSYALKEDGTGWAWGWNNNGQLGDGSTTNQRRPVKMIVIDDIEAIAIGNAYLILLKRDQTVWAWGINNYGQLGDGTTVTRSSPVRIDSLENIAAIAAGYEHSMALTEDGFVLSWGRNNSGQLGDGTTVNKSTPIQVHNISGIQYIAASGGWHSFAMGGDGIIWVWGQNNSGQLGDGTRTNRLLPVPLLQFDGEPPTMPTDLRLESKTGSSVTLTWTGSTDNVGVEGYEIFRDGVSVGSASGTSFTDSELIPDTVYTYSVRAFDAAGNFSEHSETISAIPLMPRITGVTPVHGSTIGGPVQERLTVNFANSQNAAGSRATFEFSIDGLEWTMIDSAVFGPYVLDSNTIYFYTNWDLTPLASDEYLLRYTVYDAEDNSDSIDIMYDVNRTPPAAVENLGAEPDCARINLTWSMASEAIVSYYNVYRSEAEAGPYSLLKKVDGRATTHFTDGAVQAETTYYYKVRAVDKFDQEGSSSNIASAQADPDTIPPVVLGIAPIDGTSFGAQAQITVRAEDNVALAAITLQYYDSDHEDWVAIETIETANNAVFTWTTEGLTGDVQVRAIARDAAGNESDGLPVRTYYIDTQGPEKVENLRATPYTVSALLQWDDVSDDDFAYFQVERKSNPDGEFVAIGTTDNRLRMTVSDLEHSTTYWFRVVAYDRHGNRGTPSDELAVTTTADITRPYISDLGPQPGYYAYSISLRGTAIDDVGVISFTFQISDDLETWDDIVTLPVAGAPREATVTYDFDISGYPDGTYYVRGVAVDEAGNVSITSSIASYVEYRFDHTPPQAPAGFRVEHTEGSIILAWDLGQENNLKYYRVSKALSPDGPYTVVRDNLTALGYQDRDVQPEQEYYYKVSVVDAAGNESELAGPVAAQLSPDTEAPEVVSIHPGTETGLPAYPKLHVLAADNYKLARITAEYWCDHTSQWLAIGSKYVDVYSDVASFIWDTDGLEDGVYVVRYSAEDQAGNISEPRIVEYELKVTPPAAPLVTVTSGDWNITVSWEYDAEDEPERFQVYRSSDGEDERLIQVTADTSFTDSMLNPAHAYSYAVEVIDQYGNSSRSKQAVATPRNNDIYPPTAIAGDDRVSIIGMPVQFDGTLSTDNDRIASHLWEFGDGTTAEGARPVHIFAEAGVYTVSLTVTDPAGNSDSDTLQVTVQPQEQVGTLEVRVLDVDTGEPLSGASVYVDFPDNTPPRFTADGTGIATIVAAPGNYNISAYKTGYLPAEINATVLQYQNSTVTIQLERGELVVGDLSVRRLDIDEIAEAGIDVNAPENQFVYKFDVHLEFAQAPLPVSYVYVNGHGDLLMGGEPVAYTPRGTGGGNTPGQGRGNGTAYPKVITHSDHPDVQPTIAYLVVSQEISWLKEFFEVGLVLTNMAEPQFVLADSSATLQLPAGLSLATTEVAQSRQVNFGDIAGQESREAKWVIRGDEQGYYDLAVDFNGTLLPFNDSVQTNFQTSEPFRVWGGDALHIYVDVQDAAYIGEQYFAQFRVTNESDIPIYNLKTTLGAYMEPNPVHEVIVTHLDGSTSVRRSGGGFNFVLPSTDARWRLPYLQNGDSVEIDVLAPGESIHGTYAAGFAAAGDPYEVYYVLRNAFHVTRTGSNVEVPVTIRTIPSHVSKSRLVYVDNRAMWADPVDTTTGAFVIEREALSVLGATELSLDLEYNSLLLEAGDVGKGWSHNFEQRLEEQPDGTIKVYWSPSNYNIFFPKDHATRHIYGEEIAGGTFRIAESDLDTEQEYVTWVNGLQNYLLKKHDDGAYTLTCDSMNEYLFDASGQLSGMVDKNGRTVAVERPDSSALVIAEPASGQTLTLHYSDEGLIERVTDRTGRSTTFAYSENNCLAKITDPLGNATTYTYDEDGRVLTGTDGEGVRFIDNTYDSKGRVASQVDGVGALTRFDYDETSEFWRTVVTITDRNGNTRKHVTNRLGQFVRIEDELGRTTHFTYDGLGNRTSEVEANGNATIYTYDERGNLLTVSDAEGTQTAMTYDDNNNVLTLTNADGNDVINTYDERNLLVSTVETNGGLTTYTYNEHAQILSKTVEGSGTMYYTYEDGLVKTVTDFLGNVTSMEYDEIGRLLTVTDREGNTSSYTYDAVNSVLTETDPLGNTVSYTYDARYNKRTETDQLGNTTEFRYNGNGQLTESIDALGNKTRYIYDGEDRLLKTIDSEGNVTETVYDPAGQVITVRDAQGNEAQFTYHIEGLLATETAPGEGVTAFTYYKNGQLHTSTDALGNTSTHYYDPCWRLSQVVDAEGNKTAYTYDSAGNIATETDPLGNTISYTYDSLGRLISVEDALGNVTEYGYDANGNLLEVTDALGNKTRYVYDKEDRVIEIIDARGNSTSATYDAAGNLVAATDALGNSLTMEYDAAGNLIETKDAYGKPVAKTTYDALHQPIREEDALGNVVIYDYDSLGQLIEIIDALNRKTKLHYNEIGQLTTVLDPLEGESSQSFDADGNLATITDPNGNQQSFNYDELGRLVEESTAIGSTKTYGYNALSLLTEMTNGRGQETTFEYDAAGRLVSFTDPDGTVTYTYDANGNILTVTDENGTIIRTYDALGRVKSFTDVNGNTIEYTYDEVGNLTTLTYPGGQVVEYEYDAADRLTTVTDWNNRVTTYEYDKNGRLNKTIRPNGSELTITHDDAGQIIQKLDTDSVGNIINQYDYTYDASGKVTVELSATEPRLYDLNSLTMVYDEGNRLVSYDGQDVEYDADGNMTFGPLDGQMVEYIYDSRNRLIQAGDTEYIYDAENNRIASIEDGVRTDYVTNPHAHLSQLLVESTSGNETYYVYGIGLIGHQEPNGAYRTYHFDIRGSTTAITNQDGVVTDRFQYGPYGELVKQEGTTKTPFLYNGRDGVQTENSGLYYMRARYYNPEIKRFINQDVLMGDISDGRSLNRYAYAGGNPVTMVDPFGLSPEFSSASIYGNLFARLGGLFLGGGVTGTLMLCCRHADPYQRRS
ncbi:MAG: PKD domain-containing protein [Firmicutes bacterium]|nr:PKD domain-containing protein [Bacillota bacterium]